MTLNNPNTFRLCVCVRVAKLSTGFTFAWNISLNRCLFRTLSNIAMCLFVEIVHGYKPLTIYAKKFHPSCLIGFWIRLYWLTQLRNTGSANNRSKVSFYSPTPQINHSPGKSIFYLPGRTSSQNIFQNFPFVTTSTKALVLM